MKLLVAEGLISAVYIFDVSTYPFIHVPFYLLTLLYFASTLEVYGMFRVARALSRRFCQFRRDNAHQLLQHAPLLPGRC